MKKLRMVCSVCNSEDVLIDSYIQWNYEKQDFEIASQFHNAYCVECDGECNIKTIEEEDDETNNTIKED